jgi:hypothetical protein
LRFWLTGLIIFFVVFVWVPVEWGAHNSCFNNYDLGIYGQAISLIGFSHLNPWLSTRDVFLFGDHFDPILILAAPLRRIWHPSLVMIRIEMLSLLLAAASPLWLYRRRLISWPISLLSGALILLGPLTLDAAFFPAHPGTWSLAPLSWMMAFMVAHDWRKAFGAMLIAFLCKEEYPAATMILAGVLWWQGQTRIAVWIAVMSGLWLIGVFFVRPAFMDSATMYTDAVSSGGGLSLLFEWDGLGVIFKRLLLVILPAGWLLMWMTREGKRPRSIDVRIFGAIAAMFFVMIAVRLLGGYWGNHRSAPLSIFMSYFVIVVARDYAPSKRALAAMSFMAAVLILPGLETGSRLYRGRDLKRHCPGDPKRLAAISEAETLIRTLHDGPVLAAGNLVPRLADLPGIAQIGATKSDQFRYFLTETYAMRNPWPLSVTAYDQIENTWRSSTNSRVLLDNQWILLIRNEAYHPVGGVR